MSHRLKRALPFLFLPALVLPACHRAGGDGGLFGFATQETQGAARYLDVNRNGVLDQGDQVIVTFSEPVQLSTTDGSIFRMPVIGNSLGAGATLAVGPTPHEVTIELGANPLLKTRQTFAAGAGDVNRSSGIALSPNLPPDTVEVVGTGEDAIATAPIDIAPGFVQASTVTSLVASTIAIGDMNGDGILDIVATDTTGFVEIRFGDGMGNYPAPAPTVPFFQSGGTIPPPVDVKLGDVDRDGDLDMAIALQGLGANVIFLNDGTGTFLDSGQALGSSQTHAIALADLDADGDLDLISANDGFDEIFGNDGDGQYAPVAQLENGSTAQLAVIDMDRDGRLDILTAHDGPNLIWRNEGDGSFSANGSFGSGTTHAFALGDVNRDGRVDVLAANEDASVLWSGTAAGFEIAQDLTSSGGTFPSRSARIADIDADGALDVVLGTVVGVEVWMNDSTGILVDTHARLQGIAGGTSTYAGVTGAPGAFEVTDLAVFDTDLDGDLDIVGAVADWDAQIWSGSLAGTWGAIKYIETGQSLGIVGTFSLTAADLDRDGDLDILTGNNFTIDLWTNIGQGVFTMSAVDMPHDVRVQDLHPIDVDLDGDIDIVAGNFGKGVLVYINDGSGGLTAFEPAEPIFTLTQAIAVGDVDGDGFPDMVIANANSAADVKRINLGVDTFGAWLGFDEPLLLGGVAQSEMIHTGAIVMGDLDRDGDLDLVTGQGLGSTNYSWKNDGNGNFQKQAIDLMSELDCRALSLGDMDGDGILDLLVGQSTRDRVLLGDGTGNFTFHAQLSSSNTQANQIVNLDGDADLDALVGNGLDQGLLLWEASEPADFGDMPSARIHLISLQAILAEDIDGDGDIDIVLGGRSAQEPTRIHLAR
jgi:hypothetical protein